MMIHILNRAFFHHIKKMCFVLFLCLFLFPVVFEQAVAWAKSEIVVLDSGHGGKDTGAVLAKGLTESELALMLAKKIEKGLENYKVVLSRNTDYGLELYQRAETAAHNQARLFISIHAGPGWASGENSVLIGYYDAMPAKSIFNSDFANDASLKLQPWGTQAQAHIAQSRDFAMLLKKYMQENLDQTRVRTGGFPFTILAGVDAPSVLVEFSDGFLNQNSSESVLNHAAQIICLAISDFLR